MMQQASPSAFLILSGICCLWCAFTAVTAHLQQSQRSHSAFAAVAAHLQPTQQSQSYYSSQAAFTANSQQPQPIYSSHSAFTAHSEQWRGYLYTSPQTCLCDHTIRQHLKLLLRKVPGNCLEPCIHLPLSRVPSPVQVLLLPDVDELAVHDKSAAPFTLCETGVVDVNHPYLLLNVLLHA